VTIAVNEDTRTVGVSAFSSGTFEISNTGDTNDRRVGT
jgi:hypothetical protein